VLRETTPANTSASAVHEWVRNVETHFETWVTERRARKQQAPTEDTKQSEDSYIAEIMTRFLSVLPDEYVKEFRQSCRHLGKETSERTLAMLLKNIKAQAEEGLQMGSGGANAGSGGSGGGPHGKRASKTLSPEENRSVNAFAKDKQVDPDKLAMFLQQQKTGAGQPDKTKCNGKGHFGSHHRQWLQAMINRHGLKEMQGGHMGDCTTCAGNHQISTTSGTKLPCINTWMQEAGIKPIRNKASGCNQCISDEIKVDTEVLKSLRAQQEKTDAEKRAKEAQKTQRDADAAAKTAGALGAGTDPNWRNGKGKGKKGKGK
ncbi:unnamed protein product, partial [Amoebophrya sp. A25]